MVPPNLLETFRLVYDMDFSGVGIRCVGLFSDTPYDTNPPVQPEFHDPLAWFPGLPSFAGMSTLLIVGIIGFLVIKFSDVIPVPRRP